MKKFLLLFFALAAVAMQGQTLTERLLWADTSGTCEIEPYSYTMSFDCDGNYFFLVKKDKDRIAVTNKTTTGELCYAGGGYRKGCSSRYLRLCNQKNADFLYVMNKDGTNIYGPIAGTVQGCLSGGTRQHFANTSVRNDTAFFYLDGRLVYSSPLETIKQFILSDEEWVDFWNRMAVLCFM